MFGCVRHPFTGLLALFALLFAPAAFAQEVAITVTLTDDDMYVGDNSTVVVTATEGAGALAAGLVVTVTLPSVLNIDDDGSSSLPAPTATASTTIVEAGTTVTWTLDLGASSTESLTIPFVVDTQFTGDFDITATHSLAPDATPGNDTGTDTLTIGEVFTFPAGTQVQVVGFVELESGLERMVLGVYLGAPGVDGAVWCRVPEADSDVLTISGVPDLYRVCSDGLPSVSGTFLPLHPNDMWLDETGTNAGRLYMTTWGSEGLYYSEDQGESWTGIEPDLGDGYGGSAGWVNVYGIVEDATDGILYISANNGLVFRSLNDGTTWQKVSSLPEGPADTPWSLHAHPTDTGTVFAGTLGKGVYVSLNFGISWDVLNDNDTTGGASDLVSEDAGYIFDLDLRIDGGDEYLFAATSRGVWRMQYDGTQEWEELDTDQDTFTPTGINPEVRDVEFGDIDSDGTEELYAVTWGFGVLQDATPFASNTDMAQFALRGAQVTLFAVSPSGMMFVDTKGGGFQEMDPNNPIYGSATAIEPESGYPLTAVLHQNYPNPFNPSTAIAFDLTEASRVSLTLHDTLGRLVATLVEGHRPAGSHSVMLDAGSLAGGTYLYRLTTPEGSISRVLALVK